MASRHSSRTCTSTRSTRARAAATSPCRTSRWWARRKGIGLLGTGDFTHPAWYDHLRETLRPAEPGLYRLEPGGASADIARRLPPRLAGTAEADPVRFMLSVEISTIYKRDDRTRKVHHLIYLPDLDAVARFNTALGRIGNLGSDGRPILGLDSRDLLEITLEASPDGYLVPAHIWTPWFSALGSKSGFDAIADCYADLAEHIFAVETGLSSDPAMNWRVASLDRYRLVSNSDAHSPPALAREATVLRPSNWTTSPSGRRCGPVTGWPARSSSSRRRASTTRTGTGRAGSTGRRSAPGPPAGAAPSAASRSPSGVLSRVEELADRPGRAPAGARPRRHPPGAAGRDPRRDQQGGAQVEEGRGAAQRAGRRARPGAGDPDHDAARRDRAGRWRAARRGRSGGCAAATCAGCPATTASTA